jgi:hypothetical protein
VISLDLRCVESGLRLGLGQPFQSATERDGADEGAGPHDLTELKRSELLGALYLGDSRSHERSRYLTAVAKSVIFVIAIVVILVVRRRDDVRYGIELILQVLILLL